MSIDNAPASAAGSASPSGACGDADPSPGGQPTPRPRRTRPQLLSDVAALTVFGLLGLYLTLWLWPDPTGQHVAANRQDSVQHQWLLLHAAQWFTGGEGPLFTKLINAPFGVNLMANTSVLAFALPLAPITLTLGPAVSAALLLTLTPALTAAAWYHVMSRHLVRSRLAAFLGALFTGFAPAMVSHDTGHPNIVAQFTLPFIVLTVLRMRIPGRAVRTGLELAGLVVVQIFINEEVLFLTAVTLGLFILAVCVFRPAEVVPHVRSALAASGVTALVAGAVVAYPLWHQFFGPMAYRGLPTFVLDYGADLASFPAYATEALVGPTAPPGTLGANATEENAFYGWVLLAVLAAVSVWLWRVVAARALILTGLVLAVLSLGRNVTVDGERTEVVGPWTFVSHLPLFDSVVPTRLTVFLTPIIALLFALAVDRALTQHRGTADDREPAEDREPGAARRVVRYAWVGAVVLALVSVTPTPIDVAANSRTPEFFVSGVWRDHLPKGATILPVPLGWDENVDVMQWQLAADLGFATPGGYYLAPAPTGDDRRANFGPVYLPTLGLLNQVAESGRPAGDDPRVREQTVADLRTWRVDAVVVLASAGNVEALRATLDRLVGPGQRVEDVWLWDVRGLTG